MQVKKSTRKFVKNRLKDVITQRRKNQKDNKWRKAKGGKSDGRKERPEDMPDSDGNGGEDSDSDDDGSDAGFEMDEEVPNLAGGADFEDDDMEDDDEDDVEDLENLDDFGGDQESANDDDSEILEAGSDIDDAHSEDGEGEDGEEKSPEEKKEKQKRKHLRDEIAEHKRQLEEVMKKDPVFYEFLKDNDPNLLDFEDDGEAGEAGGDSEDDLDKIMKGDSDDEEEEPHMDQEEAEEEEEDSSRELVTKEMIAGWRKLLINSKSLKTARKVVLALRAAIAGGESQLEENEVLVYRIEEKSIYNQILISALKDVIPVLNHHLPQKLAKGKIALPSSQPKWKKLAPLVKSFLKCLQKVLDQAADEDLLRFVIRQSEGAAIYFACFPKLCKDYLKQLLKFWTSSTPETKILAFLAIRNLSVTVPSPYLDLSLKGLYTTFSTACRTTNIHTLSAIDFMINCIVEISGIDPNTTYYFGFIYIRQLAILLRGAMNTRSKDATKNVYCWQFVHCLRVWARVLATYCEVASTAEVAGGNVLKPLIYPLVQVALGTLRLKPSVKYFPLRFQCLRILNDVGRKTGTFIPIAAEIVEVFQSAEFGKKPKPSTLKPLDFRLCLKTPAQYVGSRPFQQGAVEESISILVDYFDTFALSISFPELVIPVIVLLKRYIKNSKNFVVNKEIQHFLEALESNHRFVNDKRNNVDFSPKDVDKASMFLMDIDPMLSPLRKYAVTKRKVREDKLSALQAQVAKEDATKGAAGAELKREKARERADGGKKKAVVGKKRKDEDEDDEVEDFVLSDDDDDEEGEDEMEMEFEGEGEEEEEEEDE
ncbi:Nucleolar Complex 2 protein [Dinochytrium kinnereticum]|nr:Nucleolar Complex 2 protein [Dinochytrium kinnereticum]